MGAESPKTTVAATPSGPAPSGTTTKSGRKAEAASKLAAERARAAQAARKRRVTQVTLGVIALAVAIGALFAIFQQSNKPTAVGSGYQVGSPGIGATAPAFDLAASTGGQMSLAGLKGKTVLLYFQEGLTCQPCWDQIAQLEKDAPAVKAAGVDQVVSVTSDPADLIRQKTTDMHLSTPVLSDPDLAVSKTYQANSFGMMGDARDGHTFILITPDGVIRWRADYGGAPKYTMDVPVDQLLADLEAGEK